MSCRAEKKLRVGECWPEIEDGRGTASSSSSSSRELLICSLEPGAQASKPRAQNRRPTNSDRRGSVANPLDDGRESRQRETLASHRRQHQQHKTATSTRSCRRSRAISARSGVELVRRARAAGCWRRIDDGSFRAAAGWTVALCVPPVKKVAG